MGIRNNVLGSAGIVGMVWDQGKTKQTSMEREDCVVLDSSASGCGGRVCDDGFTAGTVPC